MKEFFEKAAMQNHPLRVLQTFLEEEKANEQAKKYGDMRFVGYVLEIGYDAVTIITSDPYKIAVGGVPRNSLLIMVPANYETFPLHFTLLRVLEAAPTPLSKEVQQTYFELQKKSMPELDVFTQSELQWGALKTGVLGMFYPHPQKTDEVEFSGDMNNFVSAHKYLVYGPDDALLKLIINSMVSNDDRFSIGELRLTECRLPLPDKPQPQVTVYVSTKDFMGTRTAMFGKTRLGKSNVVKLIAESLIETTDLQKAVFEITEASLQSLKNAKAPEEVIRKLETKKNQKVDGVRNFREEVLSVLSVDEQREFSDKVIAFSHIKVGQLLFDITGEYANDNPQDDSRSLKSVYPKRCIVYALTPKEATPSNPLKLNFYEQTDSSHRVLGSLLRQDGKNSSAYVNSFISVELFSIDEVKKIPPGRDQVRIIRKLQMFWAILKKAGYPVNESQLQSVAPSGRIASGFNPGFSANLREAAYLSENISPTPPESNTLNGLVKELEVVNRFRRGHPNDPNLTTGSGNPVFDSDDIALLEYLEPQPGRSGTTFIQPYRMYHDHNAGDFVDEILEFLDSGETVILDLGNANPEVMNYFSGELSRAVFSHQVDKFTNNRLGDHYVQLYFEEAHNLFPHNEDVTTIYSRFAKEGAKYHIGMVYSTQSPTTVNRDLLAQTENFFVAHLSSQDEVNSLAKLNISYQSMKDDILQAKTVGYIRMLTRSHRFVVSMQARKFTPPDKAKEGN